MLKTIIVLAIAVIVVLGGAYFFLGRNQAKTAPEMNMTTPVATQASENSADATKESQPKVTIKNFQFGPGSITIKAGQSIEFANLDDVQHSATADDGSWDTGLMGQGEKKTITFSKAGTYAYHCSVHPNMHGTVIVK